jgi:hypothetical protein
MQKDSKERQQMFAMIENWQQSGLTQKQYCRQQDIRYHVFHYWYKVYRDEQQNSKEAPSAFVALQLKSTAAITAPYAELLLPNGKRLVFHYPVDVGTLQALLP